MKKYWLPYHILLLAVNTSIVVLYNCGAHIPPTLYLIDGDEKTVASTACVGFSRFSDAEDGEEYLTYDVGNYLSKTFYSNDFFNLSVHALASANPSLAVSFNFRKKKVAMISPYFNMALYGKDGLGLPLPGIQLKYKGCENFYFGMTYYRTFVSVVRYYRASWFRPMDSYVYQGNAFDVNVGYVMPGNKILEIKGSMPVGDMGYWHMGCNLGVKY